LAEAGFEARGIDLDEGMLDVAREKALSVENMDALTALRAVPDQTLAVISAFHLIEHVPFEMVRDIALEAHRVLRPGGIMILETPNPENLVVGLVNFHLDATHNRPLPPALTSFVTEHAGFARNVILRLQGATPQSETATNLTSLLTDISLDYAVVAQVEGPQAGDLDDAFALQLGMDLYSGVSRFDEASHARIATLTDKASALHEIIEDSIRRQDRSNELLEGRIRRLDRSNELLEGRIRRLDRKIAKGPLHLRQLIRHPKAFGRDVFGINRERETVDCPYLAEGFIDRDRCTYLSLPWVWKHPRDAVHVFTRQPGKALRFIGRQPNKFLTGKGSIQKRFPSQNRFPSRPFPPLKAGMLYAHRRPFVLAVDLTPVRPDGANGGLKGASFILLKALGEIPDYHISFIFITSSVSHHQIRELARPGDKLVCVNHNGSFVEPLNEDLGETDYPSASEEFLQDTEAKALYCPFGDTRFGYTGLPTIVTIVDLLFKSWPHSLSAEDIKYRHAYVSRSITRADRIQCISRTVMAQVAMHMPQSRSKLSYLYLPIHERLIKVEKSYKAKGRRQYFFYPANFWKHKNHEVLLIAYFNYRSKVNGEPWDLVLSGNEDDRTIEIRDIVDTLGITDSVEFVGFVSEEELAGLFSNAGALVFPSLHEGFGIPPVEAMSFGIPMVIGDAFATPEICGDACIKVDPRKPHDLANAMFRVSNDEDLAEDLVKKGHLRLSLFNLETEAKNLADELWLLIQPFEKKYAAGFPEEETSRLTLPTPKTEGLWTLVITANPDPHARISIYVGDRPFGSYSPAQYENKIELVCRPNGEKLKLVSCGSESKQCSNLVSEVRCHNGEGDEILLYQGETT
jgi:glycosyltransferase involved in cell wall biosynthesis